MNGRLLTDGARPALRFERHLAHPVERVWRAITDPEELRHWSPAVPQWTLEPGATFTIEGAGEETGRIVEVSPPHLLVCEWGGDRMRYELAAEGDGCLLVFEHEFGDRDLTAQTAAGWDVCLDRLEALLAGAPLAERESLERWPQLHERYAAAFGIDPEIGRRTFAQHMAGD
jgi:uncharacterized protein YndB with AHSA1/START domain